MLHREQSIASQLAAGFAVVVAEALLADELQPIVLVGDASDSVLADVTDYLQSRGLAVTRHSTLDECAQASTLPTASAAALLTIDAETVATGGVDQRLGAACRLFPARLLLRVSAGAALAPADLYAFGFRCLARVGDDSLHEYRLSDYKTPPDWLNARFWANPERFALDASDDFDESGDEEE